MVTHADGFAERDAALLMLHRKQMGRSRRITVGADKAYDTRDFVRTVRELNVTPHVAKNDKGRASNLDRRPHASLAMPSVAAVAGSLKRASVGSSRPAAAPGQAAWLGESRLAVRLQLRRTQLAAPAQDAYTTTTATPQEAVCLNGGCRPRGCFPVARKPYEHRPDAHFKQISTGQRHKPHGIPPTMRRISTSS